MDEQSSDESLVSLLQHSTEVVVQRASRAAEEALRKPRKQLTLAVQEPRTSALEHLAEVLAEVPIIKTNSETRGLRVEDVMKRVFKLEDKEELVKDAQEQSSRGAAAEMRFWEAQQPAGRTVTSHEQLFGRVAANIAEAASMDIQNFSTGYLKLFNPSIVLMPPYWRRTGEQYLAAFRFSNYRNATGPEQTGLPKWYSSYIVLTTLDAQLRQVRPLRVLGSKHFFGDPFDCHLDIKGSSTLFGPEDGRLFIAPGDSGEQADGRAAPPKIFLFFTGRAHSTEMATPCSSKLGQRMFISELGSDLRPFWTSPILVPGERDVSDALGLNQSRTPPDDVSWQHSFNVDSLNYIEKNWSPFLYRPQTMQRASADESGSERHIWSRSQLMAVYSFEPHVLVDINVSKNSARAGSRHIYNTSFPGVAAWKRAHKIGEEEYIHVSTAPMLLQREGRPNVYLSVLHVASRQGKTWRPHSEKDLFYRSFLYTFEATPPFRVLGIGDNLLPLPSLRCLWEASVAFPMEIKLNLIPDTPELWVLWGRGDTESHRTRIPWARVQAEFMPKNENDTPGLTLVMMSHSRKRLPDLKKILRSYRALPAGLLEEIVLIWNNPEDVETAQEIAALNAGDGLTLRVIHSEVNSMNNRFAVWEAIRTEGVIVQDDDMWVELPELVQLISAWRANPDALVGPFVERDHFEVSSTGSLVELSPTCGVSLQDETLPNCTFWGDEYSMLLPHPWVVKTDYLRVYMAGRPMTKLVDDMINCDDIYFNAVVANATGVPPVAVDVAVHRFPRWKDDSSMWGSDSSWAQHRTECLKAVNDFYRGEPLSAELGTVWRLAQTKSAAATMPCGWAAALLPAVAAVVTLTWRL